MRLPHGHSAITSLRLFSAAHAAYAPLLLNSAGSRPAFDRQSSESEAFRSGAVPHLVQRSQRLRERRSHPTRGDQVRCPLRSHLARGTPCTYARTSRCPPDSTLGRSEEHTSELQSLMRISYAVFCL